MLHIFTFFATLVIGSYNQEIITDEHKVMYNKFKHFAETELQKEGFNGFLKDYPDEVWSQLVNGKNIVMRSDNVCIHLYDHFGKTSFVKVILCESIFDALNDQSTYDKVRIINSNLVELQHDR